MTRMSTALDRFLEVSSKQASSLVKSVQIPNYKKINTFIGLITLFVL